MSRIGKKPVSLPAGVTVERTNDRQVVVKGPKGELRIALRPEVDVKVDKGVVSIEALDAIGELRERKAFHGMTRALISNMVKGVSQGFKQVLDINGVGLKAQAQGKKLTLNLGFSHDVNFPVPDGIEVKTPTPTQIEISGADRQSVGQVAANIRAYKRPEPYKGKGIKYAEETVLRKEGKKK